MVACDCGKTFSYKGKWAQAIQLHGSLERVQGRDIALIVHKGRRGAAYNLRMHQRAKHGGNSGSD